MGPEARYQKSLIDQLRSRGAWICKYPAGPHGSVGVPDLLACYRGRFLAIECKAAKAKTPTAMQQHQLDLIVTAGGLATVSYPGSDDVAAILDSIDSNEL